MSRFHPIPKMVSSVQNLSVSYRLPLQHTTHVPFESQAPYPQRQAPRPLLQIQPLAIPRKRKPLHQRPLHLPTQSSMARHDRLPPDRLCLQQCQLVEHGDHRSESGHCVCWGEFAPSQSMIYFHGRCFLKLVLTSRLFCISQ
jgi:hypothetical protein